jgi:hypothetical protein
MSEPITRSTGPAGTVEVYDLGDVVSIRVDTNPDLGGRLSYLDVDKALLPVLLSAVHNAIGA